MLKRLRKIHAETWIGLVSYIATFTLLFRATNTAVGEPLGATLFAGFMSVGLAIPVYLILRAVVRAVSGLYRRYRLAPKAQLSALIATPVDEGTPEKRFRLARHGSIDPAYGRPESNTVSAASAHD